MTLLKLQSSLQNVHLLVSGNALWAAFFFIGLVFAISCLVYIYHWKNYGTNAAMMTSVTILYVAVGLALLAVGATFIAIR